MTTTLVRWTVEDYHTMIAAGLFLNRQVELLNGQVVEMSPEGPLHADLNRDLGDWFRDQLGQRARVSEGKPITLNDGSEPQPDVAIVRHRAYRDFHPFPEDVFLVIELANTSFTKDTHEKYLAYAAAGIGEYWVVNLRDEETTPSLIIYRDPSESGYQSEQRLTSGSIAPLAFPDITLDLHLLFQF